MGALLLEEGCFAAPSARDALSPVVTRRIEQKSQRAILRPTVPAGKRKTSVGTQA
jgi:hypothetical protein